jgi:hypothetical protein
MLLGCLFGFDEMNEVAVEGMQRKTRVQELRTR